MEDESIEAMDIKKNLESFGYEVPYIASYGDEAIQKAQEINPDLILMDIVLKGEVDGIIAAEKIKKLDIPVVYITAHSEKGTVVRAKNTSPYGYILKPFQAKELALTIEMAIYKHEMEKNLKKNEEKFRLLYENAPLPYQSLNEDGIIIEVNDSWLRKMDFKRGEVIGRFFTHFLTSQSKEKFKKNFPIFLENGDISHVQLDLIKKDGKIINTLFEGKISYDLEGNFKNTNCIFQDITSQMKAYKRIKNERILLSKIINTSEDSIYLLDTSGIIILANKALADTFNLKVEDMVGHHIREFIPRNIYEYRWKFLKKAITTNKNVYFEDERDGTYFHHKIYPVTIDDQLKLLAVYSKDISYEKKNQERLKAIIHEKDSLLKEIHHRVKNNLQIISSLLSLQMEFVDDLKSYELFRESRNRVKSMAMVHEKLYIYDKMSHIDFYDFTEKLISELLALYSTNNQITKKIRVDSVQISIYTAVPCAIILNELISNSIKHAFPHGRLGELEVILSKVNDDLELIVKDNGVGFPEDVDLKKPKTLGLQLVNILVKQLNGRIELETNHGTSFKITFKNLLVED